MIYNVEITDTADSDLRGIYEYIAFDLMSPLNAANQLSRLEKHILSLEQFPEGFSQYQKEPWKSRGLRILPVDNYLVMFIVTEQKQVVTVIRVMYGGRDVDNQLKNHTDF